MRYYCMLFLAVLAFSLVHAVPPPVFTAHPRFEITMDKPQAIAHGDAVLARGLTVPKREGQWIFYYACPKDGSRLVAETPERHVCPTCKAVYTDERTQAAYRTLLQDALNEDCITLGLAFAQSGDNKYAQPVRAALLELAARYPTWEHHDRWGRTGLTAVVGGWRYSQLLDESVGIARLARAYDLIANAPCLTAADRKTIENDLLRYVAKRIQQFQAFVGAKNNHQTWFNSAYVTVGVATGDTGLLTDGVYGPTGLLWQLQHSVTDDGLWYEGTMAYHFYALQAIVDTLTAAKRAGWDFRDNARLKSLWLGPIDFAYPNGQFPVTHDSDPGDLRGRREFYRFAADYFGDPVFAAYAQDDTPAAKLASRNLTDIGMAILRRGSGADAVCAMIDYGQHGDAHGHPDKLNLLLYGLGQELLLDPGRISYSVPEYTTWCRTTLAHNTVVIDGQDQRPDTGRCRYFADTPTYATALTASDGAYPGIALRRMLLLTDRVLVDVYVVKGTETRQFDWLAHGRGTLDLPDAADRAEPLGIEHGYQHLTSLRQRAGAEMVTATFTLDPARAYRVWCLNDTESTFVAGLGIGYTLHDKVAFLLRRRTAQETAFVTVYDLGAGITAIDRLPLLGDGKPLPDIDAIALRLHSIRGTGIVAMDLRDAPTGHVTVEDIPVNRCLVH